ncbi:hypothetical protein [Kitasatospora aureofaciens]|uniref:hypothetical protein n=1 Tax=Kitasatospora aureofaciens TaxID=1894 RepID=UPI0038099060
MLYDRPGGSHGRLHQQDRHREGDDTGREELGGTARPAESAPAPSPGHQRTAGAEAVGAGVFDVAVPVSPKPMKCAHSHTSAQTPAIVQTLIFFALDGRGLRRMCLRTT